MINDKSTRESNMKLSKDNFRNATTTLESLIPVKSRMKQSKMRKHLVTIKTTMQEGAYIRCQWHLIFSYGPVDKTKNVPKKCQIQGYI